MPRTSDLVYLVFLGWVLRICISILWEPLIRKKCNENTGLEGKTSRRWNWAVRLEKSQKGHSSQRELHVQGTEAWKIMVHLRKWSKSVWNKKKAAFEDVVKNISRSQLVKKGLWARQKYSDYVTETFLVVTWKMTAGEELGAYGIYARGETMQVWTCRGSGMEQLRNPPSWQDLLFPPLPLTFE